MPRHTSTGQFSLYHLSSLRRPASPIAQAVAILARYGGSLWLAGPAYTFTGSDGTGAAGDNSDTGYVRDLCASYGPELRAGKFNNSDGATFTNNADGSTTVTTNGSQTYAYAGWFGDVVQGKIYEVATNANASSRWIYYLHTPGQTDYVNIGGTAAGVVGEARNVISVPTGQGTRTRLLSIRQVGPEFGSGSFIVQPSSIREVVGRPLFQSTTGFKPKLRRVPKLLGPELVTNGDFSQGSTGWSGVTPGASFTGGAFNIVSTNGEYQGAAQSGIAQTGKTYVVQADVVINSGGGGVAIATAGVSVAQATTGKLYGTLTATASNVDVKRATGTVNATVDNVSVREVLEWGWAWVGDGTDDTLVSAAQPTTNTAETMGVAYWHTGTNSKGNGIHYLNRRNSAANLGMSIYQGAGSPSTSVIAGYGTNSATALVSPTASAGAVVSLQADATNMRRFLNGVQVGSDIANPYSFATNAPIYLMSAQGGASSNTDRPIFAAYYAPAMLPAAERLIVERAMAQLAGVTI